MEFFSSWLKNIVFISITVSLLNLILPENMGKYVKVITGFTVMLVMVQPFTNLLNSDVYFDNLYLKHTSIMEENIVSSTKVENVTDKQESLTVKVYKDKLTESIKNKIEQTLELKIELTIDIHEKMSEESFGTLKSAKVIILEEPESGLNINIKKVDLSKEELASEEKVSKKSRNKINNFFLNFYNLDAENITISKNE